MSTKKISIGYFGQKKSGKSSIINYIFFGLPNNQTLQLPPTQNPTLQTYKSSLLQIDNFEIPGKFDTFEKLSAEDCDRLSSQDVFIYVFDLRFGDTDIAIQQLRSQLSFLIKLNPHFLFYIFFHQSDLDFLYVVNRVEETINVFRRKFESIIKEENFDLRILDRYHIKKTSIYDYSINGG